MDTLHIDIETYSSVDITKSGLYKYVQSLDFEVLLLAYARNEEPVNIIDLAQGEQVPLEISCLLRDPSVAKMAHNAAFEWYCLSKAFGALPLDQWYCTMAHALYRGYPASLGAVGKALGLEQSKQKLAAGKALIRKFCVPCRPTKTNGGRMRNLPRHEPAQWQLFKDYCVQDVVTEREIHRQLSDIPLPANERRVWLMDIMTNAAGVKVDAQMVQSALRINEELREDLTDEAKSRTGLDNPNSVAQLKDWLTDTMGEDVESLNKENLLNIIDMTNCENVKKVLRIRQELSRTSIKKYDAMENAICADGRVRGLLQYYGANRTGRWAGRLVQVQNLPRNYLKTLDMARRFAKNADGEALKMIYGNVPDTLSQLIRTAFIPSEGFSFAVADYSAIEARVIAWLAGEQWRLDVFNTHGKIYEASASQMFGVPIEKIAKGSQEYELRQKGKVAELALGYQGSKGALIQMGALNMGLIEEELPDIVRRWRQANRRICDLWYAIEQAAVDCVEYGRPSALARGLMFSRNDKNFIISLPSGRQLFYVKPKLVLGEWGKNQLYYEGMNQTTKKWELIPTYGGKLVENIVQAIARDCLAEALVRVSALSNCEIVMHIHDEIVAEVPQNIAEQQLEAMIAQMCGSISWAKGLPLNADGFVTPYYKKD